MGGGGGGGGAVRAWGRVARVVVLGQQYSLLFCSEAWEVGAVGVLEERKACGQWRGRVGAVRAVGAVGAVGAGGAGGRAGAAIEHYFLFSSLLSSEYGSMWAVGAVGVLEERKACNGWR